MDDWDYVIRRINKGQVVPILSNSFRIEEIFREEKPPADSPADPAQLSEKDLTIEEVLTKRWAEKIDYPLPDVSNLARVAQYYLVKQKDNLFAREQYLEYMKESLLGLAEKDSQNTDLAKNLRREIDNQTFSNIVNQLEYPHFSNGTKDPLRVLAELPLPLYITTSPYDFLERALAAAGKTPVTQVCFWSGTRSSARPEHLPEYLHSPDFKRDPDKPIAIVYHLYGLEDYPQTMVLSEDDYMNFLVSMAQDDNTQKPILPLEIRGKLAEQTLLLLGYQLWDWDFRVLFRFIAKYRTVDLQPPRGIVIQLKQDRRQAWKTEDLKKKSLDYLTTYLDRRQFDVEWSEAEIFVRELAAKWEAKR